MCQMMLDNAVKALHVRVSMPVTTSSSPRAPAVKILTGLAQNLPRTTLTEVATESAHQQLGSKIPPASDNNTGKSKPSRKVVDSLFHPSHNRGWDQRATRTLKPPASTSLEGEGGSVHYAHSLLGTQISWRATCTPLASVAARQQGKQACSAG